MTFIKIILFIFLVVILLNFTVEQIECNAVLESTTYKLDRKYNIIIESTISYCDGLYKEQIYPHNEIEVEKYIKSKPIKLLSKLRNINYYKTIFLIPIMLITSCIIILIIDFFQECQKINYNLKD